MMHIHHSPLHQIVTSAYLISVVPMDMLETEELVTDDGYTPFTITLVS